MALLTGQGTEVDPWTWEAKRADHHKGGFFEHFDKAYQLTFWRIHYFTFIVMWKLGIMRSWGGPKHWQNSGDLRKTNQRYTSSLSYNFIYNFMISLLTALLLFHLIQQELFLVFEIFFFLFVVLFQNQVHLFALL